MSTWLIAACGCAYFWVAIEQTLARNWPMVIVYFGYAAANVGLVLLAAK